MSQALPIFNSYWTGFRRSHSKAFFELFNSNKQQEFVLLLKIVSWVAEYNADNRHLTISNAEKNLSQKKIESNICSLISLVFWRNKQQDVEARQCVDYRSASRAEV